MTLESPDKLPRQIVGNVGMYYACFRLSLMGWNAMPTSRNAKGIDIVAYTQSGKKMIGIQVKTLSGRSAVPLGTSLDKIMGDFWVIVNNAITHEREVFIMTAEEVKQFAKQNAGGKRAYWLEVQRKRTPREDTYERDEFKSAWHKIGRGDDEGHA